MFEVENKFYQENRESLRSQYLGKRVVIVKNKILGVYDSDNEAIDETTKTMKLGTFCVKYIPVDPQEEYHRIFSYI
ncbi:MAG: hypothetical protein FWD28_06425 [Treponema sp.]|nr:hypothetical protein [Treponema sp.]